MAKRDHDRKPVNIFDLRLHSPGSTTPRSKVKFNPSGPKADPRWLDPRFVPKHPLKDRNFAQQVRIRDGQLIDPRPFYWVTDHDLEVITRIVPECRLPINWTPIEHALVTRAGLNPEHVEKLSVVQIVEVLRRLPATPPVTITLSQAAAIVQRRKDTLRKRGLPEPTIRGGGGKPDEWDWAVMRRWLREQFPERSIPENPPVFRD